MTSKTVVCGICDLRKTTKPSVVWCSECDEGLCLECQEHHSLSKGSRNHNTVPTSDYEKLPTSVLKISQFCSDHHEKFAFYCKKHDHPCCGRCIISVHQKCQDLVQLNDMIINVKKSYDFNSIEQAMIDMIENIQQIKNDRQENLSTLKKAKKLIEDEIELSRIKLNAQLDKFQEDIMKELHEAESRECKMICQLLASIEKNENEIRGYQENLINIKQHASDLQTFLAMKQMERDVAEKEKYFTSLVTCNKLNQINLSCKMNDDLPNSFNKIGKLGEIIVSSHSSEVAITRKKETRAQTVLEHNRSMTIDNLSFVLQSTIHTKLDDVTGCMLLPDGKTLFSCFKQRCVRGFNSAGFKDFYIRLTTVTGMTYMQENNYVAITDGSNRKISIIDSKSRKVKETIPVKFDGYGIVSRNNTLIVCAQGCGLQMINLTDKSVNNIVTSEMSYWAYVTTSGDKLYYTDMDKETVTCCDFHGSIQWEFKDKHVLSVPLGVAVDHAGNVYVVGRLSNTLVVISPDGQRHRQLLSYKDGLCFPQTLYYDKSTNKLLVANAEGGAFIYKLN